MRNAIALLCGAALLPACATIVSPGMHSLNVESTPPGAICDVSRNGESLGSVPATPGPVTVSRSSRPMQVTCRQPSAAPEAPAGQATVTPELNPWFFGNILFGGLIGIIVDASTGAVSRYPESVRVTMPPAPPASEPVASGGLPASAPAAEGAPRV